MAYSREEAIAQVKATRYRLTEIIKQPDELMTLSPMGSDCNITCVAGGNTTNETERT